MRTLLWATGLGVFVAAATGGPAGAAFVPNHVPVQTGIGSARGDSDDPGDGSQLKVIDGTGLTVANPSDPTTWTHTTNWQDGWQHKNATSGTFILDFGSVVPSLADLYIWNVNEGNATNRGAQNIDVFYATAPAVTPTKNTVFDFTSGGWNPVTSLTLSQAPGNATAQYNGLVNLGGVSARYVGIRMNNNYGGGDVGFAEIQATSVPEPASVAGLGVVAAAGLGLRRRRR